MRAVAKAGLVALGYIAAVAIALLAVRGYISVTSGADRESSAGIFAFADSLVFLAAFGVAAVPATGAALFFLKARPRFWVTLSVGSLVIASTSLVAFLITVVAMTSTARSPLPSWSGVATLRILVAPLFAMFFLLCAIFAPNRSARISLIAATTIELVVSACVAFTWFHPYH